MAGKRIDDIGDAKRLAHEYGGTGRNEHGSASIGHTSVGPAPVYGVVGTGMPGGIEADLDELRVAEQELARLQEGLMEHLRAANALTEPMQDGTGPVTTHMRRAFLDRADIDGGVQAALSDYLTELLVVRGNILDAIAGYQGVDEEAMAQLNQHATELDREAP